MDGTKRPRIVKVSTRGYGKFKPPIKGTVLKGLKRGIRKEEVLLI